VSGPRFLLATRSAGKLREFREIFLQHGVEVIDVGALGIPESEAEDGLEVFDTFEENALAKARYFFEASGGVATFADDSGLVVDALGGEPGVISKRWSGRADLTGKALDEANNQMLVRRMHEARRAHPSRFTTAGRYVSVAAFKDSYGEVTRRGEVEGVVLSAPRGANGFGYDAYFDSPAVGGTFAELTIDQTARLSHRSRAFAALLSALRAEGRV
jgi:XTP/dITP diphosphohydrolase